MYPVFNNMKSDIERVSVKNKNSILLRYPRSSQLGISTNIFYYFTAENKLKASLTKECVIYVLFTNNKYKVEEIK